MPASAPSPRPWQATCRCGATWPTMLEARDDWLDPVPPILPVVARTPCPGCQARTQVVRMRA